MYMRTIMLCYYNKKAREQKRKLSEIMLIDLSKKSINNFMYSMFILSTSYQGISDTTLSLYWTLTEIIVYKFLLYKLLYKFYYYINS